MDRREFTARLALVALAVSGAASAQPVRKVYRIGILGVGTTSDMAGPQPSSPSVKALLGGMRDLGYVYGEQYVTEPRGAGGNPDRYPALAVELVQLKVDVILAGGGPSMPALKQATTTIPIVMAASGDPVADGYVQSLARPGGNITGLSLQSTETTAKRLELLKELVPGPAPVAVFWDAASNQSRKVTEVIARERGWNTLPVEIRDASAIEAAFKIASDGHANAALAFAAGVFFPRAQRVAELAARSRLPVMYELRQYVDAGGLISYGANINQIWRQAAGFVDKILRGAKPGDLPIEQPTKFELVINLKTARALGLTIPPSLLVRADEVIE
jgi:putative tryptophan/tyrosine transport system substrate-binding protein